MASSPTSAWISAFAPFTEREFRVELKVPITMPAGRMIHDVPGAFLRFPMWTGAPFIDDFGKKSAAMIDLDGEHLFPELAVLRLLEKDGWSGRWVNTQGGGGGEVWKFLTEWKDVPRAEQRNRPIEDSEPRQLLARIAGFNKPRRYKGCWDIYAWRADEFAFAECKRSSKPKELVSKEQEDWLRSALYIGDRRVSEESFCFVQWDYA